VNPVPPVLLDSNVMIALAVADHVHHESAEDWLDGLEAGFATCPITQGALVRIVMRAPGGTAGQANELLAGIVASDRHEFWSDDVSYLEVPATGLVGFRQVTDAYLAQLARHHRGRVATFDKGFAALHPDVVELVPIGRQP
jgi:toxin-antitoxin system PIN domain toxin